MAFSKEEEARIAALEERVQDLGVEFEQLNFDARGGIKDILSIAEEVPELRRRIEWLESQHYFYGGHNE